MKKNRLKIFGVIMCVILIYSCEKDDVDAIDGSKSFSVYGLDYEIKKGLIWHGDNHFISKKKPYSYFDKYTDADGVEYNDELVGYTIDGTTTQTGNYSISLYGDGISYHEDLGTTVGQGPVITFHLSSESLSELKPGKYKFGQLMEPNTFTGFSSVEYTFNVTPGAIPGYINEIADGEVDVINEGGKYRVSFNCKTASGSNIIGQYNGEIQNIDIRKSSSINDLKDLEMGAAFDKLKVVQMGFFPITSYREDFDALSVYNSSTASVMSIQQASKLNEIGKNSIELALIYHKESETVEFISPLELRSQTWRGTYSEYNADILLPCHTSVQTNPAYLSAEAFDNIESSSDFEFVVEGADNQIPVDTPLPIIVAFESGNGLKGALKITDIQPQGTRTVTTTSPWFGTSTSVYDTNPVVTFELKTPVMPTLSKLK